ncbi:HAD family hydrolase [Sphingomonas kyeonggiensis]|uniref:Putative hydrolase of the HAD superfamily n=1 Tax=Sphingomonas kyeonggiensis TaxID=1268553 RepID=A0A7W6NZ64_9SPHN|nr:HAD family hydrolase [Sphingomonas kyeonggiensis]MBB4100491.1 putative hydrolase of the HAD superfamily [Sphingomonas kyeonggiensis]
MSSSSPVILADADNTLWDTDAVFAGAQLGMLSAIDTLIGTAPRDDALGYIRDFDQALAALDHRHLRYPPAMLVRALALGANGLDSEAAARRVMAGGPSILAACDVDAIVAGYSNALGAVPQLMPGVVNGLTAARAAAIPVWILSEGAAGRQRDRARVLGIEGLVQGVSEATKTLEQFARQRQRFAPSPVFVVGDQPDRDIAPAVAAGCVGVLVPSKFRPKWLREDAGRGAGYVADSFNAAVDWIIAHTITPSDIAAE